MALYKATVSFSGVFNMSMGEVGEVPDSLVDDLTKAGYIIPYEATKKVVDKEEKPKRKGKKE